MKELSDQRLAGCDPCDDNRQGALPLRKGFGSLSDAIDVGSVSLTLHMESLDAAALLHTSRKQVLIHADGAPIFEGVSFDDADVDLDMNTDYVYASLKFKPYSSLFEQAKVPSDTVLTEKIYPRMLSILCTSSSA